MLFGSPYFELDNFTNSRASGLQILSGQEYLTMTELQAEYHIFPLIS